MAGDPLPALALYPLPGREGGLDMATLAAAMNDRGAFQQVGVGLESAEYALLLSASRQAGVMTIEAEMFWFNERIDQAQHEFPEGSASQLADLLTEDLRARRVFASDVLHARLQSSPYVDALSAAPEIGAFEYVGLKVLHNPLYGASLRYRHRFYENVHADVFVYPVAHWVVDAPERLDDEMALVRLDFQRLEEAGYWRDLSLDGVRTLQISGAGRVLACDGEFRTDRDWLATTAYLYVRGDKFVKIRASFAKFTPVRADIEAFALSLPLSLAAPAESPFMARRRAAWRAADQES